MVKDYEDHEEDLVHQVNKETLEPQDKLVFWVQEVHPVLEVLEAHLVTLALLVNLDSLVCKA